MSSGDTANASNYLIDALPHNERKQVIESSEVVLLEFGLTITEPGQPMAEVLFPLSCWISQIITLQDHNSLEMNLIGNEGMLGSSLLLDVIDTPLQLVVQGAGSCLTISRPRFLLLLAGCPALLGLIKRYHFVSGIQLAKMAACTHFHAIEQRLARCLLMTQDRAHTDHFHLTHGFLAEMLGVRRSGVTIAAGSLQAKSIISYTRGEIIVLDRKRLEEQACDCYKVSLADYERYL